VTVDRLALAAASSALQAEEVVGLPTDTVYGLGVLAGRAPAARRLFEMKGRPDSVAVAVLVADLAQAEELCGNGHERLGRLAERFWPGALTVVVARRAAAPLYLGGDDTTIGLRCPDDDFVRELARELGPLAVSSANRHGEPPLTSAAALRAAFPGLVVVDGGVRDSPPSSVISLLGPRAELLRHGELGEVELREALGE
jgi:tRNA threonylcarbamoyl adenosine modification protein (Sua5/YciO/YrdC/YwlC family)